MYRQYFNRFYNYGKKICSNDLLIEDTAHEALLLVWERRASLKDLQHPSTYFYRAFRNILITQLRQQLPSGNSHDVTEELTFSAEQFIIAAELAEEKRQQIKQALLGLTSRQREAIFLRFYEGLSYEEVSSVLGIKTKATYKIVARAISSLRSVLKPPVLILLIILAAIL